MCFTQRNFLETNLLLLSSNKYKFSGILNVEPNLVLLLFNKSGPISYTGTCYIQSGVYISQFLRERYYVYLALDTKRQPIYNW